MKLSQTIFLSLVLFLTIQNTKATLSGEVLIVDAGSSGTRMFLIDTFNNYATTECGSDDSVLLANIFSADKKQSFIDGMSTLASKCVTKKGIPQDQIHIQKVFLFSTAGSRDEIIANIKINKDFDYLKVLQSNSEAILTAIGDKMNQARGKVIKVKVISGRYEGIYGFLALFVELGREPAFKTLICGTDDVKTCMGKIIYQEVGGSSSQVAFTSPVVKRLHRLSKLKKGIFNFKNSHQIGSEIAKTIYSRSFLGNGKNVLNKIVKGDGPTQCPLAKVNVNGLFTKASVASKSAEGATTYAQCLASVNAITDDNTLPPQNYADQYTDISSKINKIKKTKLIINSGGTYVPWNFAQEQPDTSGKVGGKVGYTSSSKLLKDFILEAKNLCALDAKKVDDVSQSICLGMVLPEYYAGKLGLDPNTVEVYLIFKSWTPGALYFSTKLHINDYEKVSEGFLPHNTNNKENDQIDFQRLAKQHHSKRHHLKRKQNRHFQ